MISNFWFAICFVASLHQLVYEAGGGGEADGEALLAGGQAEPEGNEGLACPVRPKGDDILSRRSIHSQRASSSTCILYAIKHLVLCHVERRPPKLDLDVYPYLPRARVGTTSAASYMCLMAGGSA
jgi:hypothetical protein